MAKYLLLKHYRGAPAAVNDVPMEQWTPEEISAHVQYMRDFADRLVQTGEYVDGQALAPEGTWVRYDGEGRPPVTDGPFAETKDLIAGWMVIDVDSHERAVELAGELSAAPGAAWEADPRMAGAAPVPRRAAHRHGVPPRWMRHSSEGSPRACSPSSSAAGPTSRRPRTPYRTRWWRPSGSGKPIRHGTRRAGW